MGIAISVVVAAVAVIYGLSVTATTTPPVESLLQVLVNIFAGSGRILSTEEAVTALAYSVVIYLVVFSITYFFARFIGLILMALGVPDEEGLRVARQEKRDTRIQTELLKRQAKLIARHIVRAQQAAARRQAAGQASVAKVFNKDAPSTSSSVRKTDQ
ncbi:MAG: hypothetical protein U0528_11815 [Anaerolineae bacterium]|nr:hypothetical protein [Anaerolineae bacterium]